MPQVEDLNSTARKSGQLAGKVVIVTGAASGIGKATVELIIAEGGQAIVADIQDEAGLAVEAASNGQAKFVHCDVTDEMQIKGTVDAAVATFGRLDGIFSNAGVTGAPEPADGVEGTSFDSAMAIHVKSALFAMKYAVPEMRKAGGGSIVSTASAAALQAGIGPILYSTAKGALVHMSRVAALELAGHNIRVNCICPGMITTPILTDVLNIPKDQTDDALAAIGRAAGKVQPIPRGGVPSDIAEAAVFLLSERASWITGQSIAIDGGMTLGQRNMDASWALIFEELGMGGATLNEVIQE